MKRDTLKDPLEALRRFTRPSRKRRGEADLAFCRHLGARAPGPSGAAGGYWCRKTLSVEGPDGLVAQPEACTDERACFEPASVEGQG